MKTHRARTVLVVAALILAGSTSVWAKDKKAPKISVDGKEVETIVPAAVRGRNVLIPGDLVVKLGVSLKWDKKTITLAHRDKAVTIKIDGGKKGGDLEELDRKTDVPRIPARVLREDFNLNVAEWKRGQEAIVVNTKEPFNPFKEKPKPRTIAQPGQPIPDFRFPDLDDKQVSITSFTGKRLAILVFASWDLSRDTLARWQGFLDKQEDESVQFVGVAVESQGKKWVEKYVRRASAKVPIKFPILIDSSNHLSRVYGFQSLPVMILADELQIYKRFILLEGTRAGMKAIEKMQKDEYRPEYIAPRKTDKKMTMRQVIEYVSENPGEVGERMLLCEMYRAKGEIDKAIKNIESAHRADPKSAEPLFRWGLYLWEKGSKAEAISKWREAAVLGPSEMIVRKQIWALEEPGRFYKGKIDLAWQHAKIQKRE